ncbi:MAG: abortive infection system antitoxin AbiGi family protein [Opitutaceae bacterium]
MNQKSKSVFHFTNTKRTLVKILQEGFWPRICFEDFRWMESDFVGSDNRAIREDRGHPLVSFCDIPLPRVDEHTNYYGKYGIGLSAEWAKRKALNPVIYLADNGAVTQETRALMRNIWHGLMHVDAELMTEYSNQLFRLIGFMKPMEGTCYKRPNRPPKNFYSECELRYLPNFSYSAAFGADEVKIEKANAEARNHMLEFKSSDVKYLIVPKEENIIQMIGSVETINSFGDDEKKMLSSKIISLESIKSDF